VGYQQELLTLQKYEKNAYAWNPGNRYIGEIIYYKKTGDPPEFYCHRLFSKLGPRFNDLHKKVVSFSDRKEMVKNVLEEIALIYRSDDVSTWKFKVLNDMHWEFWSNTIRSRFEWAVIGRA
jgi:hypothetical protein